MKKEGKKSLIIGVALIVAFALWTILILTVDVRAVGVNGTTVGLAGVNTWLHRLTGTNMTLYTMTDWLGLVPIGVCFAFGVVGLIQLIKRRGLMRVDHDITLLGIYYVIVIAAYLIFEMLPINYRPILINGFMETSYPSSTTLLVLGVMPTLIFQARRRLNSIAAKIVGVLSGGFSVFMIIGRLLSGVHWLTDIVGSVLISAGLFCVYRAAVLLFDKK
ncbi:MAG: phosphatase PAP2 family protein [Clostridia bacterium]|nr:phosphatase PAP2 family protein [Clostridia bacterium]